MENSTALHGTAPALGERLDLPVLSWGLADAHRRPVSAPRSQGAAPAALLALLCAVLFGLLFLLLSTGLDARTGDGAFAPTAPRLQPQLGLHGESP